MQATLQDILPAATPEALKVELTARSTHEVQKLQGDLAIAKSQAKAAEKQAHEFQDTLEDPKR